MASIGDNATQKATITVLNPEKESPLYRLLAGLFNEEAVTVQQSATEDQNAPTDAVLVEKNDDQPGFAVSSMASIRDQLLLVNSDIYASGTRALDDVETPDAIANLDEIPFRVRGFPENPQEKFLLIEISRHIEAMAWRAGEGRLATGFQYLSRLEKEPGARQVYDQLQSETDVDIHVYGVPDTDVTVPGLTVHGSDSEELRHTWFVVYQSSHHPHEAAALIAEETAPNTWEGFWTYDADRVEENLNYLDHEYN